MLQLDGRWYPVGVEVILRLQWSSVQDAKQLVQVVTPVLINGCCSVTVDCIGSSNFLVFWFVLWIINNLPINRFSGICNQNLGWYKRKRRTSFLKHLTMIKYHVFLVACDLLWIESECFIWRKKNSWCCWDFIQVRPQLNMSGLWDPSFVFTSLRYIAPVPSVWYTQEHKLRYLWPYWFQGIKANNKNVYDIN